MAAQEQLNELLERGQTDDAAAVTCRNVLRWAEYLHSARSDRAFISGNLIGTSPQVHAELLADALEVAMAPDADVVTHPVLLGALRGQRGRGQPAAARPLYAPLHSHVPDRVAAAITSATVSTSEPPPGPSLPGFRGDARSLPQVVPGDVFAGALSDVLHELTYERARVIGAIAIAGRVGQRSWASAARSIGLPRGLGHGTALVMRHLEELGHLEALWEAVAVAREACLAAGVDFRERTRLVLADADVVDKALLVNPSLREFPRRAVQQWMLDRWACQYLPCMPDGLAARCGTANDTRYKVDSVAGSTTAWEMWLWVPGGIDGERVTERHIS